MVTFSATDAAFEGFRITRERPRALLLWVGVQLAVSLAMAILAIVVGGDQLMALEASGARGEADVNQLVQQFRQLAPLYAILLPLGLLVPALMAAAVYRVVLQAGDSRFGFLRLGGDELRLVLLTVVRWLLWIGLISLVVLVVAVLAGIASAFGPAIGGFVGAALGLFALGLLVYIYIRLSLAPVMTFDLKRLSVFQSWTVTRGWFWRIFATYLLALAAMVLVLLLAMIIFAAVMAAVTGGDLERAGKIFYPDFSSLASYFTVPTIIYVAFSACLQAVYYVLIYAPAAVIYEQVRAAGGAQKT